PVPLSHDSLRFRTARVDESRRAQGQRRVVRRRGILPPSRTAWANGEVVPIGSPRGFTPRAGCDLFARFPRLQEGVAPMAHLRAMSSRVSSLAMTVLVLAGLALSPTISAAHPFTVDQHNDLVLTSQGYVVPGFGAVG